MPVADIYYYYGLQCSCRDNLRKTDEKYLNDFMIMRMVELNRNIFPIKEIDYPIK